MSSSEDRFDKPGAGSPGRKQGRSNKEKQARRQLKRANRDLSRQLERANKRSAMQEREMAVLRARLARREAGDTVEGIRPENIVWVLGSGKTGSSWLSRMMEALPDHARWNEPVVGMLFGHFYYYDRSWDARDAFIMSDRFRESWLGAIRNLVLDGATARYPGLAEKEGYLVIKEPWGSLGAPLLMEALPESRMIFLVRDPRDVVASALHITFVRETPSSPRWQEAEERPEEIVRAQAKDYLRDVNHTKQAYEAHEGYKVLIRYEDLKAHTLATMKHIYSTLQIPVDEGELARVVKKYDIENIPQEKKGPGTVRRRATSGGWKEDLSAEQVQTVEHITSALLEEFYGEHPQTG